MQLFSCVDSLTCCALPPAPAGSLLLLLAGLRVRLLLPGLQMAMSSFLGAQVRHARLPCMYVCSMSACPCFIGGMILHACLRAC